MIEARRVEVPQPPAPLRGVRLVSGGVACLCLVGLMSGCGTHPADQTQAAQATATTIMLSLVVLGAASYDWSTSDTTSTPPTSQPGVQRQPNPKPTRTPKPRPTPKPTKTP